MTNQWCKDMVTPRTNTGITNPGGREVRINIAIDVQHDTKSSRTSKMRRVLLRSMLSTGFNNRLGGLDIVTEERVWPRVYLQPVEVFIRTTTSVYLVIKECSKPPTYVTAIRYRLSSSTPLADCSPICIMLNLKFPLLYGGID